MSDTLLDTSSYLVAEYGTPPLVATKPNFESIETPPPLATTRESSLAPSSEEERRAVGCQKRRRGKTKPSQSDAVVLSQLDPTRPDIAKHALKYALDSESEAEEEDSNLRLNGTQMTTFTLQNALPRIETGAVRKPSQAARADVESDEDFVMLEVEALAKAGPKLSPPKVNDTHHGVSTTYTVLAPPAEIRTSQKERDYDTRPPPLQSTSTYRKVDGESLSPSLAKFMTNGADADPENTLTPMQRSPPRSHCNGSPPEHRQTLPPLSTALSIDSAASPFSARSPKLMRVSPANTSHYPSPYSVTSPPTTTNPAAWRSNTSGSTSTLSDYAITSASTVTSMSTPSSLTVQSPPHFPTLSTSTSDASRRDTLDEIGTSPEQNGSDANGVVNGGYANGSFTCNIKECTAPPFQTQYLLNSHMNVHSDTRPHFCTVPECPRGPGGQGFKRKNEMIRHGLVHTSPGYMCPFCPDQQHKYPRPDNLQRHVRVHHVDKDRDDPELRDVLAQRPEGGSRGRRRRLGS